MSLTPGLGTTPEGARTEKEAERYVREMFGRVAANYDFANHLLSLNLDRGWRRRVVERTQPVLTKPGARAVDLCCGTGDLLIALQAATRNPVIGCDFSRPMLAGAARKIASGRLPAALLEGDALHLPFADQSLDLVTCGFGFRNFTNYEAGIREIRRVLRAGGLMAILECAVPPYPLVAPLYRFYASQVLPRLGGAVSGHPDAYAYLPSSIRKFPAPETLAEKMRGNGFARVSFERLSLGLVTLHLAWV